MIHLAMNEGSGREWQKKLDILLWGYREAEHAVLGVSPYQMLYGHVGKGPLNTIKKCWTKEIDQQIEKKSVKDYMSDLKQDLEIGARVAEENCTVRQKKYINKYNEKTQDKFFEVGESVLVLMKDVSNKSLAKWIGPLIITAKLATNNYRVANKDGTTRKLHADDLRKWTARTASIGIVYEGEDEFGDIETCPTKADITDSEQEINNLDLSYLSESRARQMRELLLKYKDVFSNQPGTCNILEQKINLVEGYTPVFSRPYRVPERLKDEIDRQIKELLDLGKIEKSVSSYAAPIVCILKKDGSVRLCTDLRALNKGIIPDPYLLTRCDDLIMRAANSRYISLVDATSGYFQIGIAAEDREKTSFIVHSGQYQWKVTAFGERTSQSTYNRVMQIILNDHSKYSGAYVDDVAIFSMKWREHLIHLENVLKSFQKAGMTLKLKKCAFEKEKIKFLGHLVGRGSHRPLVDKVEALSTNANTAAHYQKGTTFIHRHV